MLREETLTLVPLCTYPVIKYSLLSAYMRSFPVCVLNYSYPMHLSPKSSYVASVTLKFLYQWYLKVETLFGS